MKLWRPVGIAELALIYDSQMREFPPRLPEQPIFYPVLNFDYAAQIARNWNAKEQDGVGYVTEFEVADNYISQFERKIVGGHQHEELWIPAERLPEFNSQIRPPINVVAGYFSSDFRGFIPEQFGLCGKTATEQLTCLAETLPYSSFDVWCETSTNAKAVFINYLFWEHGCTKDGRPLSEKEQKVIDFIQRRWIDLKCGFNLPINQ
jgi:hypothetical protein